MVDPVISQNDTIDVEAKQGVKSNRRRNNNRFRKQNKERTTDETVPATEAAQANRRPQRRARGPRAPRSENNKENNTTNETNGILRAEKADYSDGILRIKVSSSRPRTIYTRLVRLMLAGYDGSGNTLSLTQPITTVEISALGNAIGSAIFVADNLTKGGVTSQQSVVADFVLLNGDNEVSGDEKSKYRGSPRLQLVLKKVADWNAMNDDVLNKTRVFRTKVLGIPEREEAAVIAPTVVVAA